MNMLQGLVPPLCTPLKDSEEVDVDSLRALIKYQVDSGADGIFVLGSSGEAAYLNERSRRNVVQTAVSACPTDRSVLVGCLDATAQRVCDEADRLEVLHGDSAVDGIVVTAPYYGSPSHHEIERHFTTIKEKIGDLALYAYQIPSNVGYQVPPHLLVSLCDRGIIAGYKDSSGNAADFRQVRASLRAAKDVALFTGSDILADVYLDIGCSGLIPGLGNIRPQLFRALLDAHARGDQEQRTCVQRAIAELTNAVRVGQASGLSRHASQLGGLKFVLQHDGVIDTARTSTPLESLPTEAKAQIISVLEKVDTLAAAIV